MGKKNYKTFDNEAQPLLEEEEGNLEIIPKPKSRYFKTYQVSFFITILLALFFTSLYVYEGKKFLKYISYTNSLN